MALKNLFYQIISSRVLSTIVHTLSNVGTFFLALLLPLEFIFPYFESWKFLITLPLINAIYGLEYLVDKKKDLNSPKRSNLLKSLAAIPWEILLLSPVYIPPVWRVFYLIKLKNLNKFIKRWQKPTFNPILSRLFTLAFWMILITHWIACGWISLDGVKNWAHLDQAHQYLIAFYWALTTLATIGYGDITPKLSEAPLVAYTISIEFMGVALYSYIVGNTASLLASLDMPQQNYNKKMEALFSFFKSHDLPVPLREKMVNYFEYYWIRRLGTTEQEILNELPVSLHKELLIHLYEPLLKKVPLFRGAPTAMLDELVLVLKPHVIPPRSIIFFRGEKGDRMFFIAHGHVEIVGEKGEILATLGEGNFFGELSLLYAESRNATARAASLCDIYSLDQNSWKHILVKYPEFSSAIEKYANERLQKNQETLVKKVS